LQGVDVDIPGDDGLALGVDMFAVAQGIAGKQIAFNEIKRLLPAALVVPVRPEDREDVKLFGDGGDFEEVGADMQGVVARDAIWRSDGAGKGIVGAAMVARWVL
jgi:hypothetical protein